MLNGFRPIARKRSFSGFFAPPVLALGLFALAADAPAQVAIQGGRFNYFVGVRRATNGVTLFIERNKGRGGSGEVIESMNLPAAKNVRLRITANKAKCGFEYAPDNGAWKTLAAGLDATLLTTDVAGGFVGATVGLYARRDQNENK
jgi:alpha-N-arabinofuranosidase